LSAPLNSWAENFLPQKGEILVGRNKFPVAEINRRSVFGKGVIRIAVEPALARLSRSNNRMTTRVCVFTGVLIRRAIAAQRHSTCLARAQMNPVCTDLDAFFAFAALRLFDRLNRVEMRTTSVNHW
jgi:hypothetical protein